MKDTSRAILATNEKPTEKLTTSSIVPLYYLLPQLQRGSEVISFTNTLVGSTIYFLIGLA